MTDETKPDALHMSVQTNYWRGVALGFLASFLWALYNVGAKKGHGMGFSPTEMTLLRFLGGALLLLPLLVMRKTEGLPFKRLIWITLCVGPLFGMLFNFGFRYAPLSHGVFIGPFMSMVTTNFLMWRLHGQRPSIDRLVGAALVIVGLFIIARLQSSDVASQELVWIGDLCFVASGTLWGIFVYLMGRWQLPAIPTTGAVGLMSVIAFLPFYLLRTDIPAHGIWQWTEQFFYHGLIGGAGAFVIFALTVQKVGASAASLFSALVPPLAVLVAIPMLGDIPSVMQWFGVVLATSGMVVALEARKYITSPKHKPKE